jgi:hypothetical protein
MDPNKALEELRAHVAAGLEYAENVQRAEEGMTEAEEELSSTVVVLATRIRDLDEWLSRGGFPPEAWREGPDAFGEANPDDDEHAGPWHEPSEDERANYLAGYVGVNKQYRETEHGLEVREV